ncbi:MAG: glycosyltransferase family 4 protein [Actinomycetota bacterium]
MVDALMVSSSFLPGRGGIESFLAELCAELSPRLAVLAPARRDGRPIPASLPYETTGYPGAMLLPTRPIARAIEREAHRHQTDRILFGTPWPLALVGPRLRRRGLRYAVVVHAAEVLVPSAVPGIASLLARALAGADVLLPVSQFTASRVERLLERHKRPVPPTRVLRARVDVDRFHPGIDTSAARARLGLADESPVVLCLGRLVKRKGVDRLIDALDALNERVPGVVLVVAGTGPEERKLRARASNKNARVVFAGRVPDEDAPATYALADVFALPVVDRYRGLEVEGLGVVLLEASACGVPCVTGRSGGTPEAVVDGVTGFVVDASDRDRLADRIAWLLEHPDEATVMGAAGRAHVAEEFTGPPVALTTWLDGR